MIHIADLAVVDADGAALALCRAWPRGERLGLEYADGATKVAGQWIGDVGARRRIEHATRATAHEPGDVTVTPSGVMLQRHGADRRMPRLAGVVGDAGATLVVHRPERRAVVRLGDGSGRVRWAKLVPAGRSRHFDPDSAPDVRTPRLLRSDPRTGTTEWSDLAGRPLHAMLGAADLPRATAAAGRALRRLHATVPPAGTPEHGPGRESETLRAWADRVRRWAPRDAVSATADRVADDILAPATPADGVLLHRDVHDKQILVDGDDAGLLDLDTLAVGEPALDVANLLVHLELRVLQARITPPAAAAAARAFLDGYGPDAATRDRLAVYASASRARLACVYALRPPWWERIPPALVDRLTAAPLGVGS